MEWIDWGLGKENGMDGNDADETLESDSRGLPSVAFSGPSSSSSKQFVPSREANPPECGPPRFELQNPLSVAVFKESRTPPGDDCTLGNMDLRRWARLTGSALVGDDVGEPRSSLVGDCATRSVSTSILLSRFLLISSSPSISRTLFRVLSSSHSNSFSFASFISISSSRLWIWERIPASISSLLSICSLTRCSNLVSQFETSCRNDRDSFDSARSLAARVLFVVGDMIESSFAFAAAS
jgi:hypothetical protein